MKKNFKLPFFIILLLLFLVHTLIWTLSGEQKLFEQSIRKIELSETYSKEPPFMNPKEKFVLCSNFLVANNFQFLGNSVFNLDYPSCTETDSLSHLSERNFWIEKEILPEGDTLFSSMGGINALYLFQKNTTPFVSKVRIGYHQYGDDFYSVCDVISIWIVNRWYTVKSRYSGVGEIKGCSDKPIEKSSDYNPFRIIS